MPFLRVPIPLDLALPFFKLSSINDDQQMSDIVFPLSAGPAVAFEAFSLVDSCGQPKASLHASQALVGNIVGALNQARPIARGQKDASEQQLGSALQIAFTEAMPKVSCCC